MGSAVLRLLSVGLLLAIGLLTVRLLLAVGILPVRLLLAVGVLTRLLLAVGVLWTVRARLLWWVGHDPPFDRLRFARSG